MALTTHIFRHVREFSHRATPPNSRFRNALAMGALTTGTLAPFIPPAIESNREAKAGYPRTCDSTDTFDYAAQLTQNSGNVPHHIVEPDDSTIAMRLGRDSI